MTCFEIYHNTKRFFYSLCGRELCTLEDFYLLTLQKRHFIENAKSLKPNERLSMILHQDKEIFEAWKEQKNLSIINWMLCYMLMICFFIILH